MFSDDVQQRHPSLIRTPEQVEAAFADRYDIADVHPQGVQISTTIQIGL